MQIFVEEFLAGLPTDLSRFIILSCRASGFALGVKLIGVGGHDFDLIDACPTQPPNHNRYLHNSTMEAIVDPEVFEHAERPGDSLPAKSCVRKSQVAAWPTTLFSTALVSLAHFERIPIGGIHAVEAAKETLLST